jgi:hypothetical protein
MQSRRLKIEEARGEEKMIAEQRIEERVKKWREEEWGEKRSRGEGEMDTRAEERGES